MAHPFQPFPLSNFPTLREFIDAAVAEGCTEHTLKGPLVGPRGPTQTRYLAGSNGVFAILPEMLETEKLAYNQLRSLVRSLALNAFTDILADIGEDDDEDC